MENNSNSHKTESIDCGQTGFLDRMKKVLRGEIKDSFDDIEVVVNDTHIFVIDVDINKYDSVIITEFMNMQREEDEQDPMANSMISGVIQHNLNLMGYADELENCREEGRFPGTVNLHIESLHSKDHSIKHNPKVCVCDEPHHETDDSDCTNCGGRKWS